MQIPVRSLKLNSVACSPQANYTDRAAAAWVRPLPALNPSSVCEKSVQYLYADFYVEDYRKDIDLGINDNRFD
jgi:hypothetical protein